MRSFIIICLIIISSIFSFVGCSKDYNGVEENISNNNFITKNDNVENFKSDKVNKEEIDKLIKNYFQNMEKHDMKAMKELFLSEPDGLEEMNLDYIEEILVNSIKELEESNNSQEVYKKYIKEEYSLESDNIKIFEVNFTINSEKEGLQKFALIKDSKTLKWLIIEVFR